MVSTYSIRAKPSAQALMRVLNYFAQRDLLPDQVVTHADHDALAIEVRIALPCGSSAELMAEKMRSCPLVLSVDHLRTSDASTECS